MSGLPLLEVDRVDVAYGPVQALRQVSLKVHAGEIVTLIGANGAGKTTLLMSIFSHPAPHAGRILLDGEEITLVPTHRLARKGMALVPEGRRVFPAMTVAENLAMGAHSGLPDPDTLAWVLHLFPHLERRLHQRGGTLSGGEQQMLAIGRGLMSRPRLLLLDEPSLGLAPLVVKQIFVILQEIAREGTTIFLVEQNANQALHLAHRGYVLANGTIRLEGTGQELLANPQVRAAYLGGH